jgi:transcriptional regulator with XRE-family HTH domain
MTIKEAREAQKIKQKEFVEWATDEGMTLDEPTWSRIESKKVLPTVTLLRYMCKAFEVMPLDIYEREEIDLIHCIEKKASVSARTENRKAARKLTVRMTEQAYKLLHSGILEACGYPSITAWVWQCLKRLECEYAARQKKKPTAATVDFSQEEMRLTSDTNIIKEK